MKINEIVNESVNQIDEGGASGGTRYNTEVGLMCGFMGIDPETFDPRNPEKSIPAQYLDDPKFVYNEIKKFLAPNFDPPRFAQWVQLGIEYQPLMVPKINESGTTVKKYGWAGGINNSEAGAVDVDFVGCAISGVSVKAEGGITLANLTPKALGLEPDYGNDLFYHYAQPEYVAMKTQIFKDVLAQAKSQPGKPLVPASDKYSITYDPKTDQYTCVGKKTITADAATILQAVAKNATWQRVFGDWFQVNFQSKKQYAGPMFKKLGLAFEKAIEQRLKSSNEIAARLRFARDPYFYASSKSLYYVPSIDTVADLQLRGLRNAEPDGTGMKFNAIIARPDSKEGAEIEIHILSLIHI